MIVGHPGEGTREFRELLGFVEEARFERLGAFMYSEEEGTYGAEHFRDTVRRSTKQKRLDELMTLQGSISLACNRARIGTRTRVIVDSCTDGVLVCRSEYESPEVDGEILVKYDGHDNPRKLCGTFIDVMITGADEYDLTARIVR